MLVEAASDCCEVLAFVAHFTAHKPRRFFLLHLLQARFIQGLLRVFRSHTSPPIYPPPICVSETGPHKFWRFLAAAAMARLAYPATRQHLPMYDPANLACFVQRTM
jgi:hypothetical protein